MDVFELAAKVVFDSTGYEKGLEEAEEKTKKKTGNMLGTAKKFALGFGAAVVGASATLAGLATKSASTSDNIDKMSQRLGLSRQSFQELDYILSQSGVDINSFQTGAKSLLANMDKVTEGNQTAIDNFARLGVSVTDASGAMRSQEDVLFDTISAFQNMENSAEKSRLAQEMFGKQGQEILPLLNSQAGSMEELREQANKLGLVLGDDTIDAGVKLTDTIDTAKRAFSSISTQIGTDVMPIIQSALDAVINHMPEIKAVMSDVFNTVSLVVKNAVNVIGEIIKKADEMNVFDAVAEVFGMVKVVAEGVWKGIQKIGKHMDVVIPIVAAFTGAMVAFETAMSIKGVIGGVSTAIAAFKKKNEAAALSQAALNAVMNANPFMIVVTVIGALIAAFVALWTTNEDFRNKVIAIWNAVKEKIGAVVEAVKGFFGGLGEKVGELKGKISEAWDGMKSKISDTWDGIKSKTGEAWSAIKGKVEEHGGGIQGLIGAYGEGIKLLWVNAFNALNEATGGKLGEMASKVSQKLSNIRQKFVDVFERIKTVVKNAIEKVKGMFNFSWSLPKIKLPHFRVTGGKAPWGFMGEGSLPSVSVDWYKKAMNTGMILSDPTIFGMDRKGNLLGGGEAGPEAVVGVNSLERMIQNAVNSAMGGGGMTYQQNIYVNKEVSTADELARAVRRESRYGLMKGVALA